MLHEYLRMCTKDRFSKQPPPWEMRLGKQIQRQLVDDLVTVGDVTKFLSQYCTKFEQLKSMQTNEATFLNDVAQIKALL